MLDRRGEGQDAIYTYRLNEDHPRAWIAHEVAVNPDWDAIYKALAAPDFDPRRVAYVRSPIEVETNQTFEPVSIVTSQPDRLVMDAVLTSPGLLVLSEVNYPGWTATVNGSPASIVEVDGVLRGVALPAGQARVEMSYQPNSLLLGGALSGAALVIGLALFAVKRARS